MLRCSITISRGLCDERPAPFVDKETHEQQTGVPVNALEFIALDEVKALNVAT
jgi:hypothetical protein